MMAQCDPRRGSERHRSFQPDMVSGTERNQDSWKATNFEILLVNRESQVESNESFGKEFPAADLLPDVYHPAAARNSRRVRKPTVILVMFPLIFIGIGLGLLPLGKSLISSPFSACWD